MISRNECDSYPCLSEKSKDVCCLLLTTGYKDFFDFIKIEVTLFRFLDLFSQLGQVLVLKLGYQKDHYMRVVFLTKLIIEILSNLIHICIMPCFILYYVFR